jgi:hypothetical protein
MSPYYGYGLGLVAFIMLLLIFLKDFGFIH